MIAKQSSKLAALAALLVAAGCAGSGSLHVPSGQVNFTGTTATGATLTDTTTVPASGGATVATSGGSAVIPSGVASAAYPAGTPLVIIPAGTGFKLNSSTSNSLAVNGVDVSGVTLGADGQTAVNVALPATSTGTPYTVAYRAGSLATRDLTFQDIEFNGKFYVAFNPFRAASPIPTLIKGSIPNNGENAAGSFVNVTWDAINAGRSATLDIDYGNGFKLHQTQVIDSQGFASFKNLFKDASAIPDTGVQSIVFTVGDLPSGSL